MDEKQYVGLNMKVAEKINEKNGFFFVEDQNPHEHYFSKLCPSKTIQRQLNQVMFFDETQVFLANKTSLYTVSYSPSSQNDAGQKMDQFNKLYENTNSNGSDDSEFLKLLTKYIGGENFYKIPAGEDAFRNYAHNFYENFNNCKKKLPNTYGPMDEKKLHLAAITAFNVMQKDIDKASDTNDKELLKIALEFQKKFFGENIKELEKFEMQLIQSNPEATKFIKYIKERIGQKRIPSTNVGEPSIQGLLVSEVICKIF